MSLVRWYGKVDGACIVIPMTHTETVAADFETRTFTEVATYFLQAAERAVDRGRDNMSTRPGMAEAAKWDLREVVTNETEVVLYFAAANLDRGEARYVDAVARLLTNGTRETDAFARAAAETQAEAALRTLRNLRSVMSDESKLALVETL